MIDLSDIMCDIEAAVDERLWDMTEQQRRRLARESVSGYDGEESGYEALTCAFSTLELAELLGIDTDKLLYLARQEERDQQDFRRQHRVAI